MERFFLSIMFSSLAVLVTTALLLVTQSISPGILMAHMPLSERALLAVPAAPLVGRKGAGGLSDASATRWNGR